MIDYIILGRIKGQATHEHRVAGMTAMETAADEPHIRALARAGLGLVVPPGAAEVLARRAELDERSTLRAGFVERVEHVARRVSRRGDARPEQRTEHRGDVKADVERVLAEFDRLEALLDVVAIAPPTGTPRPWDVRAKRRQAQAIESAKQANTTRARLRGLVERCDIILSEFDAETGEVRAEIVDELATAYGTPAAGYAPWTDARWRTWMPASNEPRSTLRLGSFTETTIGGPTSFPVTVEWPPFGGRLLLVSRTTSGLGAAQQLLRSLLLRTAVAAPRQIRFACIETVAGSAGQPAPAFGPLSRRLDPSLPGISEPSALLEELLAEVARIEQTFLTADTPSLAEVPSAQRLGEHERCVAIAHSGGAIGDAHVSGIRQLVARGPAAGMGVMLQLHLGESTETDEQDPVAALVDELERHGATVIDLDATEHRFDALDGTVKWDVAPPAEVLESLLQRLAATPRLDPPVDWDEIQQLTDDDRWTETAEELISVPIGLAGADVVHDLWFGTDAVLGRSCDHGILVGADAAQRAALLDAFIAGVLSRYSPDEIQLALAEGPEYAGFAVWRSAPGVGSIALRPTPRQARHVLGELRFEAERRLLDLERRGAGSFSAGRATGTALGMPRIVGILDGFEQLFVDDLDDTAITDLTRLLEIGGRVGVHVLLAGARFAATGPLQRYSLLDRFQLRLALQLDPTDLLGRDEFGTRGPRLVAAVCDRPGRGVMNSFGGAEAANLPLRVATLTATRRAEVLAELQDKATAEGRQVIAEVVADGATPPALSGNRLLSELAEASPSQRPATTARLARAGLELGGLGWDNWEPEDRPLLGFLGAGEPMGRPAAVHLQRRPNEHLALVMQHREVRVATVAALLSGAVLAGEPGGVGIHLVDRYPHDAPTGAVLESLASMVGARFTRDSATATAWIGELGAEVGYRRTLGDEELAATRSELFVLCEPDRLASTAVLAAVTPDSETGSSRLADTIAYTVAHGPAVGIHLIVAAGSLTQLRSVIADHLLITQVRHRAVTRLAAEDSFTVVRSPAATTLSNASGRVTDALIFDAHRQLASRFVPHEADDTFVQELQALHGPPGERLTPQLGAPPAATAAPANDDWNE